jgi:tripartite ATP-independent transporter DctM subunit
MEWWLLLIIWFGALVLLMATGIPVAFAFLAVNIGALFIVTGGPIGLVLLTGSISDSVTKFTFIAVPMFFLMGAVLHQSGSFTLIIDAVDKWIGKVRGRLLYVSLGAGTAFAALSGAGVADTALLGTTLYPQMERQGYSRRLSLAVIFNAGLLAAIIPPSGLAVLVGSIAGVSIGKLLLAGFFPGIMMATIYMLFITIRIIRNPSLAPAYDAPPSSFSEKLIALLKLLPFIVVFFMVMGFILLGITTPSEAAATGAVGAIITTIIYRRFTFGVFSRALRDTVRIGAMIFLIIAGSSAFSQTLALSGTTRNFFGFIADLPVPAYVILVLMLAAVLFMGLFMAQISIMLVAIPIFIPIVNGLGFDPIWFWLLYLIASMIGAETPPFGLALFVMKGVAPHVPISEIYKAAIPFVFLDLMALGILILIPEIATWLPNQLR